MKELSGNMAAHMTDLKNLRESSATMKEGLMRLGLDFRQFFYATIGKIRDDLKKEQLQIRKEHAQIQAELKTLKDDKVQMQQDILSKSRCYFVSTPNNSTRVPKADWRHRV